MAVDLDPPPTPRRRLMTDRRMQRFHQQQLKSNLEVNGRLECEVIQMRPNRVSTNARYTADTPNMLNCHLFIVGGYCSTILLVIDVKKHFTLFSFSNKKRVLTFLKLFFSNVFTARCTLVQSAVLRSHVVRLSVRL